MRPGMKQIFISYTHKDQKIAKELTSMLAAAGMKVWLADEQVLPRDNVSLEVGKALEQSDAMVVLLSPDAVASQNVRREIAYALSSPKFEQRLVPVMVKPTKNIPWFLENLAPIRLSEAQNQSVKKTAEKVVQALIGTGKDIAGVLGKSKIPMK
jgi:hypothetical protein